MESSNPSWSSTPGPVDGSDSICETIASKGRKKEKSYKLHDYIKKRVDDSLSVTHLETPSKHWKLIKIQIRIGPGLESTNNEMSKNQRK